MKEKNLNSLKNLILILVAVVASVGFFYNWRKSTKLEEQIKSMVYSEEVDSIRNLERAELEIIGELELKILELEDVIKNSKEDINRIDTVIIREKEKIKSLPVSDGVLLLKENLREYEAEINP